MSVMSDLVPTSGRSLEENPVEYMAVVLNRAKGWLDEAKSIEDVREAKAIAVGMESVIREKELAFDAQLSATEVVRRCERRIGELVREGQRQGTVRQRGEGGGPQNFVTPDTKLSSAEVFSAGTKERAAAYALAEAPAEQFEDAVEEARDEGNLSRANVVRKVKGEAPKAVKGEAPKANGRSEWHHKTRHIDSNRILSTLAQELDAATAGLELMDPAALDPDLTAECIGVSHKAIATINHHLRRVSP